MQSTPGGQTELRTIVSRSRKFWSWLITGLFLIGFACIPGVSVVNCLKQGLWVNALSASIWAGLSGLSGLIVLSAARKAYKQLWNPRVTVKVSSREVPFGGTLELSWC